MNSKYCEFSSEQINNAKHKMRSEIFFILNAADPKTRLTYYKKEIDVKKVLTDALYKIGGLNSVLNYPDEIVWILSMLEKANSLYPNNGFTEDEFKTSEFRKLILDAGSEVLKIKEV